MIFICVGSRGYQFNRLIKKVDELVENGKIADTVFAQIGQSTYTPRFYEFERFMSVDRFNECQSKADIIISHGGTGALIGALKLGKQVIAVPRLAKYKEHTDDHQTQVATVLAEQGYLRCVLDIDELLDAINLSRESPIVKKYSKPSYIMEIVGEFLDKNMS